MEKNFNTNNLINLSNSFLKHFNAPAFHPTIKEVDDVLQGHQKVAVILFDGMGHNIIRKHLTPDAFIREHYLKTINSTFPPTTTAATTAFLTGLYPIETGWLSWAQYFPEYQRNIILFKNSDYNTEEKLTPDNIALNQLPIKTIFELIKENNPDIDVFDIKRYPINPDGPKKLKDLENIINQKLQTTEKCFAYFYFDSPDYEMHAYGIDHHKIHRMLKKIDRLVKRVVTSNKDTLFFTIADHGHINVQFFDICEHEDLYSLIDKPISFEKRTANFFIKENKLEEFKTLFNQYYGDYFVLMSKEEVLENKLFGEGNINPKARAFIGDYIATSISSYGLYASKETKENKMKFKGHHAGMTEDELLIDISAYNV